MNEVVDIQRKRKPAESSSSTSVQNQEQMTTAVAKKIKLVEPDNIVIFDDNSGENKENNGFDSF